MADRVLLSAGQGNIHECIDVAVKCGLGLELMVFANPDILDGAWRETVEAYRVFLEPVPGPVMLHGPFMDIAPGSPDRRANQVAIERFQHAIRIARSLNAEKVIFHANFIGAIRADSYRRGWHERNVVFWNEIAEYARQYDVVIAVENMWEFDPEIIGAVLREVDHPNLRACLDVGHARLYSDVPLKDWLAALEPYLVHVHLNNNDGVSDMHRSLDSGVIDYHRVLPELRSLSNPPSMTLEMNCLDDMLSSLEFLELRPPGVNLSGCRAGR
ncbi:MAG: sugar phosphate isomerase/epimerase family protein [Chloroflexota bacterium]|nr:MAG: hypothetical protein DIU68_01675 [Chloroflexota bacterium]